VIEGLDLSVHAGEFLVLLGPSGCGKSTLLHSIAGLLDVDGGSHPHRRARRHLGGSEGPRDRHGVPVVSAVPDDERRAQHVLRAACRGVPRDEIARRVERASRMLQLDELLTRKPSQLSGGQRQRVAIGRALVRDGAGVPVRRAAVQPRREAAHRAAARAEAAARDLGATMIYVTHDQVEAMTLASRIAVMRGGRIQQIGAPAEVYARPANMFVAGFLGAPGMNFIPGHLGGESADGVHFQAGPLELTLPRTAFAGAPPLDSDVVLGLRPEHLRLSHADHAPWCARVALVEPMGSHAVVWLDLHKRRIAVSVPVAEEPAVGTLAGVTLELQHACVFDPDSEQRV
jgi:multiple sugar transport system ATP-binding protein